MSYTINFVHKSDYLHVTVVGENLPENVKDYLIETERACTEYGFRKVLIEENLQGPTFSTLDIFEVILVSSKTRSPWVQAVAFVDLNPEHDPEGMRFAETVARNRGINVRVFATVEEAEKWLQA